MLLIYCNMLIAIKDTPCLTGYNLRSLMMKCVKDLTIITTISPIILVVLMKNYVTYLTILCLDQAVIL